MFQDKYKRNNSEIFQVPSTKWQIKKNSKEILFNQKKNEKEKEQQVNLLKLTNTIGDGNSTALYTAYTVYTVYIIQTALHCLNSSM